MAREVPGVLAEQHAAIGRPAVPPRVRSGSVPRAAVAWSMVVTTRRSQPRSMANTSLPIRIPVQVSSPCGSTPAITSVGRNRFIGTGRSSRPFSASSDPSDRTRNGYASAKATRPEPAGRSVSSGMRTRWQGSPR